MGEALVAVRWVYVHDCTGTHRDEYFFTTDIAMRPQQLVECYTRRWSIATTFQECRAYLPLESTKGSCKPTVLRCTPCLFGLYTLVVLLYVQLPASARTRGAVVWKGKTTVTFSDMITCVRRAIWPSWLVQTPEDRRGFAKLTPSLQDTILYALAPAA